jgi:predicted polyphosphate/ATP-dependent NAD kinase
MEMRIVIITGGRNYRDFARVSQILSKLNLDLLIHGGCPSGVDRFGEDFAKEFGKDSKVFEADWEAFGKFAGPKRNKEMMAFGKEMVEKGHKVVVIAFPGGNGTANAIENAKKLGLKVFRMR